MAFGVERHVNGPISSVEILQQKGVDAGLRKKSSRSSLIIFGCLSQDDDGVRIEEGEDEIYVVAVEQTEEFYKLTVLLSLKFHNSTKIIIPLHLFPDL